MLCEQCQKKKAVVHMVCLINGEQVEKWLCEDCAADFMPPGLGNAGLGSMTMGAVQGNMLPKKAMKFFEDLIRQADAVAGRKKVTKEGFTINADEILRMAATKAVDTGSEHIGTEHILWGLVHLDNSVAIDIIRSIHANLDELIAELETWLDKGKAKEGLVPQYSARAKLAIESASVNAKDLEQDYVGSEQLLFGLLSAGEGVASQVLRKFDITYDAVKEKIIALNEQRKSLPNRHEKRGASAKQKQADVLEVLSEFGRNLNSEVGKGLIDPVIGREKEVERIIQILCRRTKNNPVIIGEAGVGKTALAEALAQRIVRGDVPDFLQKKIVFSLEIGMLVAGTKYRGEFEDRMKQVLSLVRADKSIILFIDELHTIIGAGAAEGSIDAANIIKPALARGEVQVIGATTSDEYRKHIEKDAALERRFQPVLINPPDAKTCKEMLLGLRQAYEDFHHVQILPEALEAAVELSDRYITDRNLPDKAIDIMDEACSALRLRLYKESEPARKLREELEFVQLQKEEAVEHQNYEEAATLRDEESDLEEQLAIALADVSKSLTVAAEDVARVVSAWTGIPLEKLTEQESNKLLALEERLHARVVGQKDAVSAVSRAVRRARAGFKDAKRPVGSFLFLGPTGVGKTELAKALATELFGDERAMLRFDMSEYMEKHTTSRLMGAPPGYVGYDEGGQLTDEVRRKPYSVILLDEIEKAHADVFNLLLQIMDDGRLTDGQGRTIDFRNAVIIMTSNAGAQHLANTKPLGFAANVETAKKNRREQVMAEVKHVFRPEFLNRVDEVLVFDSLGEVELTEILANLVQDLNQRLAFNGLQLELRESAKTVLIKEGTDLQYGARPLRRALRKLVEDPVSDLYLSGTFVNGDIIVAEAANEKELRFSKGEVNGKSEV